MKHLLLVFIGGGTGSIVRYLFGKMLNNTFTNFPLGTFAANILGSLCIGLILGYSLKNNNLSQEYILLLATGFCGGFTTFSSFAYENHVFLKSGDFVSFLLYATATFAIGLSAVFGGIYLAKLL